MAQASPLGLEYTMRLFWQLIKLGFQQQLSYRAANLAGLATNFFFGLLRASVMIALYNARAEVAGIPLQAAITYTALTQGIVAYLSLFYWGNVMLAVRSGDIASDLLKPMDYFAFWCAQDIGRAIAHFFLRGVTIMLAYAVFFKITLPQTFAQWLALGVALCLSLLVSFGWRFLINLTAFWTPDARGIGRVAFGLSWFLSGFLMPLRFFPNWFVTLCRLTPFPAMVNTVVEVYLGTLQGPALLAALGEQVLWAVLLFAICQFVMRAGVRRLVIQGG
ncbi:MAG: ABC-2 family transporter protein [Anaerolineae bacterium]|nr:ABC-2 family transporter protein [Anaerolineae bacterium]